MKLSRELKIGVVFVTTLALFVWSYNYMKGKNILRAALPQYHTYLPQVQGLTTSSRVTMKGVVIGKVDDMKLVQEGGDTRVDVVFSLNEINVKIPANSVVKLVSDGLMGGKSLAIIEGSGKPASYGSYLKGEVENDLFESVGAQLDPIQRQLRKTLISTDSLVNGINDVLNPETRVHLRNSIARLNSTLGEFQQISASLNHTLKQNSNNIDSVLSGSKQAVDNINRITRQLEEELRRAGLAGTVQSLQGSLDRLNGILDGIEKGEGSVGKLLKDEALYEHLAQASKELEELLRDMKEHPKRYVHFSVFGKKDKGYRAEGE